MSASITTTQLHLDPNYQNLLVEIKARLKKAQLKAAIIVNYELIRFYWDLGKLVLKSQEEAKWGNNIFDVLANDLRRIFPDTEGFSRRNLYNMRQFALHYPDFEIVQALPAQLTWTHHMVLIQSFDSTELNQKKWYAEKTVEHEWPYRQLHAEIKSDLYARQSIVYNKTTNFKDKLPMPQSSLAQEMIKDPYKFHFLSIGNEAHEKDIHHGLLA